MCVKIIYNRYHDLHPYTVVFDTEKNARYFMLSKLSAPNMRNARIKYSAFFSAPKRTRICSVKQTLTGFCNRPFLTILTLLPFYYLYLSPGFEHRVAKTIAVHTPNLSLYHYANHRLQLRSALPASRRSWLGVAGKKQMHSFFGQGL